MMEVEQRELFVFVLLIFLVLATANPLKIDFSGALPSRARDRLGCLSVFLKKVATNDNHATFFMKNLAKK